MRPTLPENPSLEQLQLYANCPESPPPSCLNLHG
jgi:hypothetical protein